jgi:hypothetical protein
MPSRTIFAVALVERMATSQLRRRLSEILLDFARSAKGRDGPPGSSRSNRKTVVEASMNGRESLAVLSVLLLSGTGCLSVQENVSGDAPKAMSAIELSSDYKADLRQSEVMELLQRASLSPEQASHLAFVVRAFLSKDGGCLVRDARAVPYAVLLVRNGHIDVAFGPSGQYESPLSPSIIASTGNEVSKGAKTPRELLEGLIKAQNARLFWASLER